MHFWDDLLRCRLGNRFTETITSLSDIKFTKYGNEVAQRISPFSFKYFPHQLLFMWTAFPEGFYNKHLTKPHQSRRRPLPQTEVLAALPLLSIKCVIKLQTKPTKLDPNTTPFATYYKTPNKIWALRENHKFVKKKKKRERSCYFHLGQILCLNFTAELLLVGLFFFSCFLKIYREKKHEETTC